MEALTAIAPGEEGEMKLFYDGVSGLGGPEILEGLRGKLEEGDL